MCTFQKCNKYSSFYSTQTAVILAKKIILQNIMYECVCKSTFSHVMSTVHSWRQCGPFRIPCAVNGAVAKLKKIHSFFSDQLSMKQIREIWLPNREQSKAHKAIFVLFLCATHSFIFVNNAETGPSKET